MNRKMKIDFYQVVLPDDEGWKFEAIVKEVADSPDDQSRNETYNDMPLRLQEAHKNRTHWIGDMLKIRMDGIPPKTKLSGEQENIDLDDDEGLGEETAFFYDPSTRILVIQRNRFAVSATAFASYWVLKCGVGEVKLLPVLRSDAMQRMAELQVHRKVEVSVAGLNNLRLFQDKGKGVEALVDLTTEFQAPTVALTISMGHNRGTLAKVKAFTDKLLEVLRAASPGNDGTGPEPVTRILVTGKESEDEPTEVIDLLEDRMVEVEEVDLGREYLAARTARQNALQRAFNKRKTELEQMFAQPRG